MEEGTFSPVWEGAISKWAISYSKRNYWRVQDRYELQDIYQEAYLKFLVCKHQYEGKVTEPKHFMALYKTAFTRRMSDLSRIRQSELVMDVEVTLVDYNMGPMAISIQKAPEAVKKLLALHINDNSEIAGKARRECKRYKPLSKKTYKDGAVALRETTNHLYSRALDIDPRIDVVGQTWKYFRSGG